MTTFRQLERNMAKVERSLKAVNRDTMIREITDQSPDVAALDINQLRKDFEVSLNTGDWDHADELLDQLSQWIEYARSAQAASGMQTGAASSLPKALRGTEELFPGSGIRIRRG